MTSPRPGWNGWAIASFVLGIVACVPLGAIFGIVGLTRGKEERGRGLAVAGIILSLLWIPAGVLLGWHALNGEDPDSVGQLHVGDCIVDYNPGDTRDYLAPATCDAPHLAEVVGILEMSSFGEATNDRCQTALNGYAPAASRDRIVYPEARSPATMEWKAGNRALLCLAISDPPRAGSIKEPPPPANRWPTVGIAAGVIGLVAVAAVVAAAASKRLKSAGRRGRWVAVGAVAACACWALSGVAFWRADDAAAGGPAYTTVGRCVSGVPPVQRYPNYVLCSQPHPGEVFATVDLPDYDTTGLTQRCASMLEAYAPTASRDKSVDVVAWVPEQSMWEHGNRTVQCVAMSKADRTGSIKG